MEWLSISRLTARAGRPSGEELCHGSRPLSCLVTAASSAARRGVRSATGDAAPLILQGLGFTVACWGDSCRDAVTNSAAACRCGVSAWSCRSNPEHGIDSLSSQSTHRGVLRFRALLRHAFAGWLIWLTGGNKDGHL